MSEEFTPQVNKALNRIFIIGTKESSKREPLDGVVPCAAAAFLVLTSAQLSQKQSEFTPAHPK